jgi:ADP-ribose pyrophosphatase YjhB (NUDIX family)
MPPQPPASAHLRSLRARVPNARLFAPRVALLALRGDGSSAVCDADGELPASDLDLGETASEACRRLLSGRGLPPDVPLRPRAVHTGPAWLEEHEDVGPLQPIWIVVEAAIPGGGPDAPTRDIHQLRLAEPMAPAGEVPSSGIGGDYVQSVRSRVGHEPIFYPWCGAAVRDGDRLLLVRLAETAAWHCPGGGMEIGETPHQTVARELDEETGLVVAGGELLACWTDRQATLPNGDRLQGISVMLRGTLVGGRERDDVTDEIDRRGWFRPDALPPLQPPWDRNVAIVLAGERALR